MRMISKADKYPIFIFFIIPTSVFNLTYAAEVKILQDNFRAISIFDFGKF